ncbi:MAG TPA: flavin reductase, partial [Pantoea sp.]|nr:flavin reductase [Pantoea sp.]
LFRSTDSAAVALNKGEWLDLEKISALSIKDSALKSLMNRFVRENSVGNYSIYYGDEINGSIKQFAS